MSDIIEELEEWKYSDKAHCVEIRHDDGYGASQWYVELVHMVEKRVVEASEVEFFKNQTGVYERDDGYSCKVVCADDSEDPDFCGLAPVIREALNHVEFLEKSESE